MPGKPLSWTAPTQISSGGVPQTSHAMLRRRVKEQRMGDEAMPVARGGRLAVFFQPARSHVPVGERTGRPARLLVTEGDVT